MGIAEEFVVPNEWGLSEQQEYVIGTLMDTPGKFIPPYVLCGGLYEGGDFVKGEPAPAKLRVLIQRCRDLVDDLSDGKASIETRRGKGWRITRKSHAILANLVDD